jgi:hypothetical protein
LAPKEKRIMGNETLSSGAVPECPVIEALFEQAG